MSQDKNESEEEEENEREDKVYFKSKQEVQEFVINLCKEAYDNFKRIDYYDAMLRCLEI